ncbi:MULTISPECIES: TolC family protein [unclassified Mucilaginibacter]|uniref:TolC family protein n=1 Tax=unclassified Mucilaginibacter TaxID=2617802 RepID=UPI002AC8CB30|nr:MULTISPECIES: TolC family protein [unclassified Mucilaginibacter]MEB0261268.1 TolC family protein [Mucilaginibacter sp. 10I4]MEB0279092.1 TolC family protein [Mucilaginibacter sp. 10B2]MEB0299889.1 TolC family protein [Mucilaginibacter sp. 5C4]WPX22270.1 TolC family protein [Mucilaginibacter sp. 5C4]
MKKLQILILLLLSTVALHAQESFVNEINYPYLDKLIATAKKNYPEVKVRQAQIAAAKASLTQSKVLWLDAITASYIYSPKNSLNVVNPTFFNGYQIGISVNIGQLLSKPFATRVAKENVNIAVYQQQTYNLTVEATVKRLYFQYLEAQADLRNRSRAVTDGEIAVKQLKYTFQKGETTFHDYNESLTSLYNQNSFKVQSELLMLTAKANLEEILGVKLEEVK